MTLPLAHASHWALWVLYAVPVLIVLVATGKAFIEQKREAREEESKG
jgi:cytochrome c-type biogenesis protein CcmH/NrfF